MRIVRPTDANYDQSRRMVNRRINNSPAAILYCSNIEDVRQAIAMARQDKKKIRVRATGHSYEGFSIGDSSTYVIDVSDMNAISVDQQSKIAIIGGGSQLYYDVYLTLWSQGKFVIPGGSCPTVGVGGLTAGGGFSFSGRNFGLTCDSVLAFNIVTADGKLQQADSQNNADLFWACRGGGNGNFGVITDFTFKLYPADDVAIYRITWNVDDKLPLIANAWATMIANTPKELMSFLKFSIGVGGVPLISSFGQYYGAQQDLEDIVKKYFGAFPNTSLTFETLTNIDAIRRWGGIKTQETDILHDAHHMIHKACDSVPREQIRPGFIFDDAEGYFKASSIMLDRFFNAEELQYLLQVLQSSGKSGTFIVLDAQQNGYSSTLPEDYNAYPHRKAISSVQIYTTWSDPSEESNRIKFIADVRENLQNAGKGSYVNYPDSAITNYSDAYYNGHYQKLQSIKQKYDPTDLFTYAQAITPPTTNRP